LYRPPDKGQNDNTLDEFVELQNTDIAPIRLFDPATSVRTWSLGGGVDFAFPPNITLGAGEVVVVVSFDPATNLTAAGAFRDRYGVGSSIRLFGPYRGKLNNDSDRVELRKPMILDGTNWVWVMMDGVRYEDSPPWPAAADGFGLSLQRLDPSASAEDPANWMAAVPGPGIAIVSGIRPPRIVTHPLSQTLVASGSGLFGVSAVGEAPLRYQWRLNGTNLPGATNALLPIATVQPGQAGEYQVVVYNTAGSALSSNATLRLLLPASFLQQPSNVSARGSTNAIDYGSTTNRSATFLVSAYSPSPLSYQWRFNGVPIQGASGAVLTVTNVTLANDGLYDVLVTDEVATLPSAPARLMVLVNPTIVTAPTDQAAVVGGSFTASLVIQGNPPPFGYQWRQGSSNLSVVVTERTNVFFTRTNLQSAHAGLYRVIITNAALQAPLLAASYNVTVLPDADGDGLPDAWEEAYFGGQGGSDPNADPDGDGMTNAQEYRAGTNPTNALSYLRIDSIATGGGTGTTLSFGMVTARTYTVEYTDSLGVKPWARLLDVAAQRVSGPVTVLDPGPAPTNRVYRLVTPRAP
jgi:hypothetical protein